MQVGRIKNLSSFLFEERQKQRHRLQRTNNYMRQGRFFAFLFPKVFTKKYKNT